LPRARAAARGLEPQVAFIGALPHERIPACMAAADIGVAPFDVTAHAPLSLGFYWSPLKIFEYMAAGLPVVAPALQRLQRLVENGREGALYDPTPSHAHRLADAIVSLADPSRRSQMGAAARARAVREYSWMAHCRRLDEAMRSARARRPGH
jgi:glycosyltransferase involved in cell wall biosynthesis